MITNRDHSRQAMRGATLVETVFAVAVIGILAGAVIGGTNYGVYTMARARENQRATQILLEKAETIRLYSWDQINTTNFIPASFTNAYDPQAVSGRQGATYAGTLAITSFPFSANYSNDIKQLTITLQWSGVGRVNRTRRLTTFIAKDGLQNYVY
jgi:type II secretory pathway pseudopilin PulG